MNIKCKIFIFCYAAFCNYAFADVGIDILCLSTADAKPINMEMRFYYDRDAKWSGGFVKYQNSKKSISVVLKSSVQEIISETSPNEHTDSWLEIINGRVTGIYELVMQGAQIPSATYENYTSKRKYFFLLNNDVERTLETGCRWK